MKKTVGGTVGQHWVALITARKTKPRM